jgi:TatD DNase family protein
MILFDTHAHLDQEEFHADRLAVVQRAREAGVEKILCVGISAASSAEAVRLAEEFDSVWAAVGIHPNSTAEADRGDWTLIEKLLAHPRVLALGETGLDRYWDFAPLALQQEYFERHLRLSQERRLPVVIHCREAADDLLPLLRHAAAREPLRGVLHAFSGDTPFAEECVALGLHVGLAGNVTYKNKKFEPLRAAATAVPLERLLLETDSPYLTPEPLRGKQRRNEPAHVVHTLARLAALRGLDIETLARHTRENAERLFLGK